MYLTAAMLTGAAMFTSCSNEDDMGNVNPTYDGESVKTQFAINIPAAKQADTRLGQNIVQGQDVPVFRGMSKIKLIPFTKDTDLEGTDAFTSDAIILKDITTDGTNDLNKGAKFYSDIAVPVGTKRFLFYAEATRTGDTSDKANGSITALTEFDNGDLLNSNLTNLGNLKFTLTEINKVNKEIQTYLEGILTTVTNSLSTNAGDNETLKLALTNIKKTKVGSSDAILAIMQNLYDIVKTGGTAANTAIAKSITTYFTAGGDGTLSYKTDATEYKENANNYPAYLGIPNGAAQVEWSTDKFVYTSLNSSDFGTYTYPASLYYYRESELGASDQTHDDSWNGSSISDWNTFVGNTNYPQTVVSSSTQSIVLKSAIQYAVAQLVYNVKFATDELADAQGVNRAIGTENFKLKGILIGGQKGVNFEFEQDGTATSKTIYDPLTTATAITTTKSSDYYSLALQSELRTANAGDDDQKTVSFALEFLNNGEDFYGKDGIVPKGGTFYLVGQLETKQTDANIDAVFKKDYKTVANVTINSLKDAQYTIPDLRKTELELGLYVDLNWTAGLSQDVTIQ